MNCAAPAGSLALPDSLLLLASYLSNGVSALALMIWKKNLTPSIESLRGWKDIL